MIGQSKPSREDAIYSLHGEFYICLIVERDTGRILKADCNTILNTTRDFVASMFEGKNLLTDMEALEKEIRGALFRADAEAADRVHEGRLQPVSGGDREKVRGGLCNVPLPHFCDCFHNNFDI